MERSSGHAGCSLVSPRTGWPPPNRLAADACFTLLQFNNYRWALNGDASARIDLVRLVLIGQMLGRIVNGRAPADVDFFGSVAPSRVFAEMERIENA